jgi:hypothetical protein
MTFAQEYQGWSAYSSDAHWGPFRLFVSVPCVIDGWLIPSQAMIDTAAEWCVLPAALAPLRLGGVVGVSRVSLETRLGTFEGRLERLPVQFPAVEGAPLTVDATWFVSPDWPGPPVLGWKGCLERFKFAPDPEAERFYFQQW